MKRAATIVYPVTYYTLGFFTALLVVGERPASAVFYIGYALMWLGVAIRFVDEILSSPSPQGGER